MKIKTYMPETEKYILVGTRKMCERKIPKKRFSDELEALAFKSNKMSISPQYT